MTLSSGTHKERGIDRRGEERKQGERRDGGGKKGRKGGRKRGRNQDPSKFLSLDPWREEISDISTDTLKSEK